MLDAPDLPVHATPGVVQERGLEDHLDTLCHRGDGARLGSEERVEGPVVDHDLYDTATVGSQRIEMSALVLIAPPLSIF